VVAYFDFGEIAYFGKIQFRCIFGFFKISKKYKKTFSNK
jgi:hypothetical protein